MKQVTKPKKLRSKPKLKKDVWDVFSEYIRKRDCLRTTGSLEYGECISCGRTVEYHKLDAGHFVPKKAGNYFSERGVHAQCRKCNRYEHGNQLGYRRALVELYGEDVTDELEVEDKQDIKYTRSDLEELKRYYKEKIGILERG